MKITLELLFKKANELLSNRFLLEDAKIIPKSIGISNFDLEEELDILEVIQNDYKFDGAMFIKHGQSLALIVDKKWTDELFFDII